MMRTFKKITVTIMEGTIDEKEFCECVECGRKGNGNASAGFSGEVTTDEWADDLGKRISTAFPDLLLKVEEGGELEGFFKNGKRMQIKKILNMGLEKSNLPRASDGAIFSPNNYMIRRDMEKWAKDVLKGKTSYGDLSEISCLNLYICNATIDLLVSVLNVCHDANIKVILWHYDKNNKGYWMTQEVR